MSANLEVKGTLAKLLATEDIVVEHRAVETAQFDVDNRVLTLPIWDASNNIVDCLVAHEVGHALYTPNIDPVCNAPKSFLNITEDVRVEKLMKRKYLGIAKSFYRGYQELHDRDFFEVDDLDTYNLADKVNLHFKIGAFLGVKFTPQEQEIVNVVEKSETFEDAIAAAEALYNYCSQEQERETKGDEFRAQKDSFNPDNSSSDIDSDNNTPVPDASSSDDVEDRSSGGSNDNRSDDSDDDIKTQKSLGNNLKNIAQAPHRENVYIQKPHIIPDEIIVRNEEISDFCEEFWDRIYAEPLDKTSYLDDIDDALLQYKKGAEKEVNYLVKEFECRKSADAYARASTSRTGVLDTEKLHTYKFNEDVFKRISVLPDGKNHGLLFLLDWSGSMHNCLGATVKQLLNLVWFCKKVNIPFRVYGFTNCYFTDDETYTSFRQREESLIKEPRRNEIWIDQSYRLLEFLSSEGNVKQFERQVRTFWRLAAAMDRQNEWYLDIPQRFHLSGTPLDTSLIVLHEIIPQFKKKYDLQKVQTIILTDGESEPIGYGQETENPRTLDRKLFKRQLRRKGVFLRDRKLGTTYELREWIDGTGVFIQYLQDSFPDVNFIGIRLTTNGDFNKMLRWHRIDDIKLREKWVRNKSVSMKVNNYTKHFYINTKDLGTEVEFDPPEEATKAQIRTAFKKSLNQSKFNRKILSEFVELVA